MEVYHETATSTVAFNPYLPAIGRVLQVLHEAAPIGITIEINNRDLAAAAGLRSAGHIPRLLRQLESEGHIERVVSPQGTLIMVVDTASLIPHADRSFSASGSDPDRDQPQMSDPDRDQQNPTTTRDQAKKRTDERSRMADPPCIPNMVLSMSSQQQQLVRGRESLWDALIAAGAASVVALDILTKNPDLTVAAFEQLRNAAGTRGNRKSEKSIGLVFWCLQNNQPLHTPKESTNARTRGRRQSTPNQPQRPAVSQPPALRPGDLARLPRRGARMPGVPG